MVLGLGINGCSLRNTLRFPQMINILFIRADITVTHYSLINVTTQTCKVEVPAACVPLSPRSVSERDRVAKHAEGDGGEVHAERRTKHRSTPKLRANEGWGIYSLSLSLRRSSSSTFSPPFPFNEPCKFLRDRWVTALKIIAFPTSVIMIFVPSSIPYFCRRTAGMVTRPFFDA